MDKEKKKQNPNSVYELLNNVKGTEGVVMVVVVVVVVSAVLMKLLCQLYGEITSTNPTFVLHTFLFLLTYLY
jgi:hypothetical protein